VRLKDELGREVVALTTEREPTAQQLEAYKRQVAELQRAVEARDEMLSVVGHELRNPISPLFLQVGMLLNSARQARDVGDGKVDAAWLAPRLEGLELRIHRFLAVLDRLLDVSRLGSGHIDLVLEIVDVCDIVRDIATRFERDASAARCELRVSAEGSLTGYWDRLRLEQIVSNLLSNAVRYGAGAPIEVTVSSDADSAVLRVRDHGIGIADADQRRIFERFERAERRPRHGGFGVGLWVVKSLCQALGGTVALDSAPSRGATFTVTLPRTPPGARPEP